MAVSDRIAVMSGGVIQHVGTPKNIYQRPANLFVATFIGRSNILDGRIVEAGEGKATVELPTGYRVTFENLSPAYCKPQQVIVETEGTEGLRAVIDDCVFLGLNTHYFVHLTSGETAEIIQESTIDSVIAPGTEVRLRLNTRKANLFTEDGSTNILTGVQNDLAAMDGRKKAVGA